MTEAHDGGNCFVKTLRDEMGAEAEPPQKLEVQLVGHEPAISDEQGRCVATLYEVKCTSRDEAPVSEIEYLYWFRDRETLKKLYYAGHDRRNRIVVREGGTFWVQARRVNDHGSTRWGPEVKVTPDSLGTPTHRNY